MSNGIFIKLIIGALEKNPRNPQLKEFSKDKLQELLLVEESTLLSYDLLASLIQALDPISESESLKIQNFVESKIADLIKYDLDTLSNDALICLINILKKIDEFNNIWMLGKAILPNNIEYHDCYKKIKYLENSKISNWFKCFIILSFFLVDYPVLSNSSSIFIFVQKLLQETVLSEGNKQELRNWLQEVSPNHILQSIQQPTFQEPDRSTGGELKAHLMITVNSEKSKFRVIASLLCVAPTGDNKNISVNLNPQSPERGILCTKSQLSKRLAEFIQICVSNSLNHPNNLLGCTYYKLMVELFLPIPLLFEPIDREEIFGDGIHFAAIYPLAIRSYDRLSRAVIQGKNLWNELVRSGKQAGQLLESNPAPNPQDLFQRLTNVNDTRSMVFKENLKKRMGIKINCPAHLGK